MARALTVFISLFGDDNGRVAIALLDEAEIFTALGRFREARADLDRALAIWKTRGASPVFVGFALLDVGRLELAQGRHKEAREKLEEVLRLIGTTDPPTSAEAEFALAQALWAVPRERSRAGALANKARTTLTDVPGGKHKVARIDQWLGSHRI
jgi:tetratricopeptide (TPR) repeat protein